ncbi:sensor histidine kinase [Ancylomarina longa]|uniref:histidine kinase n=1 Tax=Ancylomarina longa TaxID=2487017 RepID=A0A434AXA6_9BACT|nr:ATP-binding protein [Ancylomarina longa]RUT79164.1 HAMP domain-containing protein [Ancylomarina longa]
MRKSLAKKLLIYFVVLNLVSILVVGVFAYTQAKDALISRTFDQLTSVRIEKKKRIEDFFQQRIHEIQAISEAEFSNINSNQSAETGFSQKLIDHKLFSGVFASLIASKRNFNRIYIYESDTVSFGFEINPENGTWDSRNLRIDHQNLFKDLIELHNKKISIHELINPKQKNQAEILLCEVITQAKHKVLIAFSINTEQLNSIMLDRNPLNGLGKSGEAYLVGEDYFLRSKSRFKENSNYTVKSYTQGVRYAFQDSIGTAIFRDYRGIKVLSSFSKIEVSNLNWAILAEIDQREAMIPIRNYGNSMFYILIILSLLLLGVVALIANTITAPIRKLLTATEKIASGVYEQMSDIKADGELMELIAAFNQMTKKIKEQQDNLQIARDKSISSMIDGQEIERSRLARELHDGLAQTILAIKMRLENTAPEDAAKVLGESKEMFSDLMHEIRSMSNDLMPAVLREFGLIKALNSLLLQIEENSAIRTSLQIDDSIKINKKAETYLYRIAQEAINNIIKHANAKNIQLSLRMKNKCLYFEISDDGKGIPKENRSKTGNGLSNIKDRISVLGGKVSFKRNNPHGLNIVCKIPLKRCRYE